MKKVFTVLLVVFFSSFLALAQVNKYDGPKPEVKAGAKSLVFHYTPFQSNLNPVSVSTVSVYSQSGNISSMDLAGAGFRYFVTNEIGVGVGVNFGSMTAEQETGTSPNIIKNELSSTTIGLLVDINYHLNALYGVSPYIGVNFNFGSYSTTSESTGGGTTSKTETSGSGFGAGLNLGFDWYFTEGLSLGGRYVLGFSSLGKPEVKSGNTTVEGPSASFFGIGTASVILNVHL
jgi:outer membrane protein W